MPNPKPASNSSHKWAELMKSRNATSTNDYKTVTIEGTKKMSKAFKLDRDVKESYKNHSSRNYKTIKTENFQNKNR